MARKDARNFKLVLEYDGSNYHGWQRQKGVLTVQEVVESRLAIMLNRRVSVRASGRTDAGVHALGQVINFYAETRLNPEDFLKGMNSLLPEDIVVTSAEEVDHSFHARFSAVKKTYFYRIWNRPLPSALMRRYLWHVPYPLDLPAIKEAISHFVGTHDFAAFMASGSSVKSTVRTVFGARVEELGQGELVFFFEANGFLRHMVRIMVGTLVEVGRGKKSPDDIPAILESRDRTKAGATAPAHGLYLARVVYDDDEEKEPLFKVMSPSSGVVSVA
ncbi:tRNA pseudouridine(38-40) synthase TruA [Thermodesulforhabdus norvegica]|uniref:tRNA pseudouridine synthase A n=1 Tax=Thermodesulforhabdus norvegica TaxID=39841 RepID=A0A1I4QGW8_9BACT|nr:tRNA pseudouridine(38-40) synthase TruA [Thermodesulforhabdus norvegica]SFM38985.1 tRNA pseudouridine38-40 synthase [Thermodesulforhabdus norvegica]